MDKLKKIQADILIAIFAFLTYKRFLLPWEEKKE